MDKWLKKVVSDSDSDTQPTQLILKEVENIDEPEPLLSSLIADSSLVNEQDLEASQSSTKDKQKKPTVVRKFNEKWLTIMTEYKNWLTTKINIKQKEVAYCKVCSSFMSPHLTEIKRHGQSAKHIANSNQVVQQNSVSEVFKMSSLTEKTRIAELKLTALFATNNLPFSLSDTLTPLLSTIFPDSKIAKNLTLKRTKATAVMQNVLGNNFLNELCDTLKQPGSFYSLIMDETTDISEIKQCAVVIIYFDTKSMSVKTQF